MSYKYQRYISRVTRLPWAITPDRFAVIAELMRERAAGHRPSDEEIAARLGGEDDRPRPMAPRQDGAIAVIPVHGCIAHRADSFEASSGGTSCELVGRMLGRAVADETVTGILLDFSTPGGSVEGVPELAASIARARAVKPVVAHVNAMAASAGYWLASQCNEIVCTPSGMVGSIGVFMLLVDESKALEMDGITINAISAGDYKLEGAPWAPLTDEARAHYQSQVDAVYRQFLSAVATGRGVSVSDVRKDYGQGRVYDAKTALAAGMVDRIATMDETLMKLAGRKPSLGMRAYESVEVTVNADAVRAEVLATIAQPVDPMPPHDDGTCEDGYEMGDDGMCHLMPAGAALGQCVSCGRSSCPCQVQTVGSDQCPADCPTCSPECGCSVQQQTRQAAADQDALSVVLALTQQ